MNMERIQFDRLNIRVYSLNTAVVGSGAAGYNAADRIYSLGQKDVAIITEGRRMGTSRNTGSDKQTYYKLTLSSDTQDSIYDMAKTLHEGGSMDGDIALIEAALSAQCFYRLVDIGVPFPHNRYGEYIGYKTDHDPRQRATSVGPLTSKMMTECLETQVIQKQIKIFEGYQVISILTDQDNAVGLLTLDLNQLDKDEERYVLFNCTNIVYATGGPAGIYDASVYPVSQTGASGIAFEAGVKGKNLTESQYGIASIKFRWNLSGTYQQVLPRYISTDQHGNDEKEFLQDYFQDHGKLLDAIFLKGYQWPFDPRKIENYGSSLIDILVYHETIIKGRRVFMDFMHNPSTGSAGEELDFSLLGAEAYIYLENSKALFGKPIDRLAHMNEPAIDLYKNNGIDLTTEYLEIAVCAQHNNGGLYGDLWWESNIKHFFPVGEVNGSHGIYRPGGSALNSGQVGSTRAAQYIVARYNQSPLSLELFIKKVQGQIKKKLDLGKCFIEKMEKESNVRDIRIEIGQRMGRCGAIVRSAEGIQKALTEVREQLDTFEDRINLSSILELPYAYQNLDLLMTQYVYLSAIENYIQAGGRSRGSYLINDGTGKLPLEGLPEVFRFSLDEENLTEKIQETAFKDGRTAFCWQNIKPIPQEDSWFENVWNAYRRDEIIR